MADSIELIQRWLEGFNTRDIEGMLAVADPEIVMRPMRWVPRSEYRGHEGLRAWFADVLASGNASTVTVDAIELLADGRIAVEGTLSEEATPFVGLYEIGGERIVAVQGYLSERALLERLGVLKDRPGTVESGQVT